jgi:hypothetical protein
MVQSWEQDIRAREEENRVAFLAGDLTVLDRLWTDDFLVNSPLSLVNDKPGRWRCCRRAASGTARSPWTSSRWPATATWWW